MKNRKRLLIAAVTASLFVTSAMPVSAAHWSEGKYTNLKSAGILNSDFGTAPETGRDKAITRGEFFSLVVSTLYGKQTPVAAAEHFQDFSNVPQSLSGYVAKAYKEKILTGIEKKGLYYIDAEKPILRQDAAVILGRALGLSINIAPQFTDSDRISVYAKDYVTGCERSALINGYENGEFRPKGSITWAESVSIIEAAVVNHIAKPLKVTTVAGNGGSGTGSGDALTVSFNNPSALTVTGGVIYIADSGNNKIRTLKGGKVSDYAGKIVGYDLYNNAVNGYVDELPLNSLFAEPQDMAAGKDGLFLADSQNNSIRLITDKKVYTYGGKQEAGYRDGKKAEARFSNPKGICLDDAGNLYVADTENSVIRKVDAQGNVITLAGQPGKEGYKDGEANAALFNYPTKLTYANGTLYVSDSANNRIRTIKDGKVATLAGSGTESYGGTLGFVGDYRDGTVLKAAFSNPTGICVGTDGTVYVADTGNSRVRAIKNGKVLTLSSSFVNPIGLCLDGDMLYVTDSFKNTVSVISLPSKL